MKHIPLVTILLWCLILVSYIYQQELFLQPAIKFPLIILLTIFLTVSFWNLQKQGNNLFSLCFIVIFLFNTGIVSYGLVHNHNVLTSIKTSSTNHIDPNMARFLITGDNERERETAARIIFERHGIALSYKSENNNFTLYIPTKSDRDTFINNQDIYFQQNLFKNNLSNQTIPLFFLLLLQIVIFTGLLIYLISIDNNEQKHIDR